MAQIDAVDDEELAAINAELAQLEADDEDEVMAAAQTKEKEVNRESGMNSLDWGNGMMAFAQIGSEAYEDLDWEPALRLAQISGLGPYTQ